MDICRWLADHNLAQQSQCEEFLDQLSRPFESKAKDLLDFYDENLKKLTELFSCRIPALFAPSPSSSSENPPKEEKKGFGLKDLLYLGGLTFVGPPVKMALRLGDFGFRSLGEGLKRLGFDFSPEAMEKRAAQRAERLKNLSLEKVTLLQDDLNEKIQAGLQNSKEGAWVKSLNIELKNGRIYLTGKVDLTLMTVELEGEISFKIQNGHSKGRVIKLEAGGFSLPDSLVEKIVKSLRSYGIHAPKSPDFDDLSWLEVDDVQNLSIGDGEVVIDVLKG